MYSLDHSISGLFINFAFRSGGHVLETIVFEIG